MLQELKNKIEEVKEETEHMGITHFKLPKMKKLQIIIILWKKITRKNGK